MTGEMFLRSRLTPAIRRWWLRPGRRPRTGSPGRIARCHAPRISCSSVVRMRAPEQPSGCPRAIAPPLTLTISGSRPSSSITARDWTAKASFSSTRPMSSIFSPARVQRFAAPPGRAPAPSCAAAPRPPPTKGCGPAVSAPAPWLFPRSSPAGRPPRRSGRRSCRP